MISNLHYFPEQIERRFGDGSEWGVQLSYSHEPELLGTAGGLHTTFSVRGARTTASSWTTAQRLASAGHIVVLVDEYNTSQV